MSTVEFSSATLNTACIWIKQPAKKNILSISRVVTFEATSKFGGMEDLRKWCKERTRWTRSKALLVGVDVMARCSLSIDFCDLYSYWCCVIVVSLTYLIIICSFSSRFCTSSSSIHCSTNASLASLEIVTLSSGGIYMKIAPIISEESWSTICS